MKQLFAYTRVSTTRQGEQGVSLQQQRASIEQFCDRTGLRVLEWLEEQETAAKSGRPVFSAMLKRLRKGEAAGVVMHKIDRSARNLKDWAELGQLIDQGVEVHFSNESVDLHSRGGRLSADIQAVVAADYIRNLREEVKKGFYGRLNQGLTPQPAPLGYRNNGPGKPKTIDPISGPIIKRLFALYAAGRFGHRGLTEEAYRLGLRTRGGRKVSVNVVARILSNPFYIGLIRLKRSGQTFPGKHEPLVSPSQFKRVQEIAAGRLVRGPRKHEYRFSRFIKCSGCGRSLVAERQKGHVYYRCHTRECKGAHLREDEVEAEVLKGLRDIHLEPEELVSATELLREEQKEILEKCEAEIKGAQLALIALEERRSRLTDKFVDDYLTQEDFEQRKKTILIEKAQVEEALTAAEEGQSQQVARLEKSVELLKRASLLYENGFPDEKSDLLAALVSNCTASGKNLVIAIQKPLTETVQRLRERTGGPINGRCRRRVSCPKTC